MLDIEAAMNNRPLVYQGEEFDEPVITPNLLNRGKTVPILEEDIGKLSSKDYVTRRMKFLKSSKEDLRKRIVREYIRALEERQQSKGVNNQVKIPEIGRVVMMKDAAKLKAQWKLGRVMKKISGKYGIVRGLKLKLGNGYVVERPIQLVCDLEIGGDDHSVALNPEAAEFVPRVGPRRLAKENAKTWMQDILIQETINE